MPKQVRLATRMNYQAARELHGQLVALAAADVEVDASEVEFLGGLAAQTLIAAQRHWRGAGQRFDIVAPSPGFGASLTELGLGDLIAVEPEAT